MVGHVDAVTVRKNKTKQKTRRRRRRRRRKRKKRKKIPHDKLATHDQHFFLFTKK